MLFVLNLVVRAKVSNYYFNLIVLHQPIKLAAILMLKPIIAALNIKLSTDCNNTIFRMDVLLIVTSEVCAATAMVNEKYRKSQ